MALTLECGRNPSQKDEELHPRIVENSRKIEIQGNQATPLALSGKSNLCDGHRLRTTMRQAKEDWEN